MAACDRLDGLADGQIDDPQGCTFDPASIQCPAGTDNASCLTPAQVDVVQKVYSGPADASGHRLYPGGAPRGSELSWDGFLVPNPQFGSIAPLPDNYLKYVGYPIGAPASSVADFKFTVGEFNRLTPEGVKGNALSLDLRNFQRAGGKLIIWQGWADGNISVFGTLDYYQRLWQANGGLAETQQWARLFMVPTLYHCGLGGYKLNTFDPFPELVDWVEHAHPPDRVIASDQDSHGTVVRTRPVSPTLSGRSTPAPAASMTRGTSRPLHRWFRRTTSSAGPAPTSTASPDRWHRPDPPPGAHPLAAGPTTRTGP